MDIPKEALSREKQLFVINLMVSASVLSYTAYEYYRLMSEGMGDYFISDRAGLNSGYRQLEKLSVRTARLNLLVYFSIVPGAVVGFLLKRYQSCFPRDDASGDHSLSEQLLNAELGDVEEGESNADEVDSDADGNKVISQEEKCSLEKEFDSYQMIFLMMQFLMSAPFFLYYFNDTDDFSPVHCDNAEDNAERSKDLGFQLYRIFSFYRTLSSYNLAYPTAVLWYGLLIGKLLTDILKNAVQLRYCSEELDSFNRSMMSMIRPYRQAFVITMVSMLPVFSIFMGLLNRNGSLVSYLKVLTDMEYRSVDGALNGLCEIAYDNHTEPFSFQDWASALTNNSIAIQVTEPAVAMNYHCFPSWVLSEKANDVNWSLDLISKNRTLAHCQGHEFPSMEVCNFSVILPMYEIFLIYPACAVLFLSLVGGHAVLKNKEFNMPVFLKYSVFDSAYRDTMKFFDEWHLFLIVLTVIVFGLLSENFKLNQVDDGVSALFGASDDASLNEFGESILLFINAWSFNLLVASGVAINAFKNAVQEEYSSHNSADTERLILPGL